MGSSGRFGRIHLRASLVFIASSFVRLAAAEPTASEKETARTMMDEGHARRDAGDHKAALAQFMGADALMHVPTTGIEVGREQIALGQLVEARDTLERIARTPAGAGEPEAFRAARKSADALDEALSGRIPALRVTEVGGQVDVAIDGAPIPFVALVAPIKVNPGHHLVSATGPGGAVRQEVNVVEGQTLAVTLTLTGPATPPPASLAPAPLPLETSPGDHPSSLSPAAMWMRWGGVGLAGVGVVTGLVTGLMSLSSTSSASKGCVSDRCPPSTWGDIDSAHTTATISTAAFIVAGAGAILFGASFFVSPAHEGSAAPHITAWIGPGSAHVGATF
jgi:hypothetical protein